MLPPDPVKLTKATRKKLHTKQENPMHLPRYSVGVGDRFAHQGTAQLDAVIEAGRQGVELTPVWNKSHREHAIVGSSPDEVRAEADRAVTARGWRGAYFVDADHVGLQTVEPRGQLGVKLMAMIYAVDHDFHSSSPVIASTQRV